MDILLSEESKRYTPPPIALFQKHGHGLVWRFRLAMKFAESSLASAERMIVSELEIPTGSLVRLFALAWRVRDFAAKFQLMWKQDLAPHIELDNSSEDEVGDLVKRARIFEGNLEGFERTNDARLAKLLTADTVAELAKWAEDLQWATQPGRPSFDDPNAHDPMVDMAHFAYERGDLEYAALAIAHAQSWGPAAQARYRRTKGDAGAPRLAGFDLAAYRKRVDELDVVFRRIVGDKRSIRPEFWTPKSFWWNHPADGSDWR